MFPGKVEVVDTKEKTKRFGGRDLKPRRWNVDEFAMLLGPESNIELAVKMDRREMSVRMQRGDFVLKFYAWLREKGYSSQVSADELKGFIEEFINDKEVD